MRKIIESWKLSPLRCGLLILSEAFVTKGNVCILIDIAKAKENLSRRDNDRAEKNKKLFLLAQKKSANIIKMIIDKYQPAKSIQWGSLLDEEKFSEYSDINIAVEGVSGAERFFALIGDAMKLTTFQLDIVQLEKIEPEFRDIIGMKGRVVYER